MAILQKQEVEIPLNGGMDVKQNAELQAANTLRLVEDLRWNKAGELEKRPATASTATQAIPSGSPYALGSMNTICSRGDEVFAITQNHGIARLNAAGDALEYARRNVDYADTPDAALRYAPASTRVSRRFIASTQLSRSESVVTAVASAIYNGETLVVAWIKYGVPTGESTLVVKAIDLATGAVVMPEQTGTLATGAGILAQINAIELTEATREGVLISIGLPTVAPITIQAFRWDAGTNDLVFAATLTANAETVKHTIAPSSSGRFYFGYSDNTSGFLTVQDRSINVVTTTHTATHGGEGGCAIVLGPTRTLIASVDGGTSGSFYNANLYAETFGNPASVTTLRTVTGTAGNDWFTGCSVALETRTDETDAAVVFAFGTDMQLSLTSAIDESPKFTSYHYVDFVNAAPADNKNGWVPNAACIGAGTVDGRAHGVFALNPDRMLTTPQSLAVVRMSCPEYASPDRSDPIARVCHERFSQFLLDYTSDADTVSVVGSKMHFAMTADPINGKPQTVFHSTVEMGSSAPSPCIDMRDGTALIGGGLLVDYDGNVPSEAQPIDRPTLYLVNTGAGAGSLSGTFSAIAFYSWIDAAGKLHRSAPSESKSVALVAERFDAYVSALPFSAYDGTTAPLYNVELYVTEDGGSTYHRMEGPSAGDFATYDTLTAKGLFYQFTTCKAGDPSYPQPYTTGAGGEERAATPPPAFLASPVRIGDLLWAINAEDPSEIWHSKPLVVGFAVEWSNLNKLTIGDRGVGISDANGVPTIFAERGIWQVYGEGPNAAGVGSFAPARRLPHEVECLDGLSVCKTGAGVFFRGRRGVYLLDTGLGLQPVGLSVDPEMVVSGTPEGYCRIVYDELSNEVHVMDFDSAKHYVYNLLEGKWSSWTQNSLQTWDDAVMVRGRAYVLHAGTSIKRVRAIDEDDHNAHPFGWTLQTPWLRFDGATSEHRVWEIIAQLRVTGSHPSPGVDVTGGDITIKYDVRDLPTSTPDTFRWEDSDIFDMSGGEDDRTLDLRCQITSQRTRQFRFRITESSSLYSGPGAVPIAARILFGITPRGARKSNALQSRGSVPSS